jgi:2-polyprenyl-3-methyl-5-hydroxy-6-metoxy-1,4-benzoquinol methylase
MVNLQEQVRVYEGDRRDLWKYIPAGVDRALDVGCAIGDLGAALKAHGLARTVVGLELSPDAAVQAHERLDQVIQGDVETTEVPFPDGYFDLVIYADVLEHLKNPWAVVASHRRLLRPGGTVVASLPNIGYFSTLLMLLRHEWRYQELGIMDYTHLRFFTRSSLLDMFRQAGYTETRLYRNLPVNWKVRLLRLGTFGYGTDFTIAGFICVARNPGSRELGGPSVSS